MGAVEAERSEESLSVISGQTKSHPAGEMSMDKIAALLERKQRKAKNLLRKIEELEKGDISMPQKAALTKLKLALIPTGYKMNAEGKTLRMSSGAVAELLKNSPQSLDGHSSKRGREGSVGKESGSSAQKVAHARYLSQLDMRATDEHRRILDSLRREREAVLRLQEKEDSKQKQRFLYREMLLEQIAQKKEKARQDLKAARASPNIAGSQGYPPLFELPVDQRKAQQEHAYKTQRSIWIKQVHTFATA